MRPPLGRLITDGPIYLEVTIFTVRSAVSTIVQQMDLYLDIDGVLIRNGQPIPVCFEFLRWVTEHHRGYWLTTRDAHGSHDGILRAFRHALDTPVLTPAIEALLTAIQATTWSANKVSAIDVASDFVWLDDDPLPTEIAVLRSLGLLERLIVIDSDDDLLVAMGRTPCR